MTLLAVGLSHRTAPVRLLEKAAVPAGEVGKVLDELLSADLAAQAATAELQAGHVDVGTVLGTAAVGTAVASRAVSGAAGSEAPVAEAVVLSTCNRVEVYADVSAFHAGVAEITNVLARVSGLPHDELTPHLYVHHDARAVAHLYTVVCGLDSMLVGEAQILGQVRAAFRTADEAGSVGRVLSALFRSALRLGKRVRTETGIDAAGASLVSVGVRLAAGPLGSLQGRPALLVGAGSTGALAGGVLRRAGVGPLVVANRGGERAERLAASLGGRATGLRRLADELAVADVVVCCTGAAGLMLRADAVAAAVRKRAGRPLFLLDLALPHDIDPAVRALPGVTLLDLDGLRDALEGQDAAADVEAVRLLVASEVRTFLAAQRAQRVAPTVVALRARAAEVVAYELDRLSARMPGLDPAARAEVGMTVSRVVDKLLHAPTVRVKQLAGGPGGDSYAAALRELFELDPSTAAAVSSLDVDELA